MAVLVAPGPVEDLDLRTDPGSGASFARWRSPGSEWFAYTEDGGRSWSAPLLRGSGLLHLSTGALDAPALASVAPDGPHRVVLLKTAMAAPWARALSALGVTVHAYVPDDGFLVRAPDARSAAALADLAFVEAVGALPPAAKVEAGLAGARGPVDLLVLPVPRDAEAASATADAVRALGGAVARGPGANGILRIRLDAERIPALAAMGAVVRIERDGPVESDMDNVRAFTGAAAAQATLGLSGAGIVGGVMDDGLDDAHPDLASRVVGRDGPVHAAFHGTAVFGILFGSGSADAKATGMMPGAKGYFASNQGAFTRFDAATRLREAWGGRFLSTSWGIGAPRDNSYGILSYENDAIANDVGVLVFQSMSNCGPGCARREAMAKGVVAVGALFHHDDPVKANDQWSGARSTRASTGPATDGRFKPDLVGPYDWIYTTDLRGGYVPAFGGTSGATPVVAGAGGLAIAAWRAGAFAGSGGSPDPAPSTLKALLVASASPHLPHQFQPLPSTMPLGFTRPATTSPAGREVQGWGLPDLETLIGAGALVVDADRPLAAGESVTVRFVPAPGRAPRASLVWTDPPATPGAAKHLVNDLDLEIRDPLGVVYRGNFRLNESLVSPPGGDADRVNNVENVFAPEPVPGVWTATVRAASVQLDADPGTREIDQGFSLVVVGAGPDPGSPLLVPWPDAK